MKVPALEWGHQKHAHCVQYNIKKTPVTFLEDFKYNISPEIIFREAMKILLKGK